MRKDQPSPAQRVVILLLRSYKWAISPMLPPACRYVPTCSEYAMEAVERYGAMRGGFMAIVRLLRCHPFEKGGYDPVVKREAPWKSGASAPRSALTISVFSPCAHHDLKRN